MISIIAAVDRRMAIGYQNKLLFWLPNDLKRFKALTTGHTIVMGRKTFESLPKGALPNRRNIVLSSNAATVCPGAEVFTSLQEALEHCSSDEDIYIIGGEKRLPSGSSAGRPPVPDRNRRRGTTGRCLFPYRRSHRMERKKQGVSSCR